MRCRQAKKILKQRGRWPFVTNNGAVLVTLSMPDGLPKALYRARRARRETWLNGEGSIRLEFNEYSSFADDPGVPRPMPDLSVTIGTHSA